MKLIESPFYEKYKLFEDIISIGENPLKTNIDLFLKEYSFFINNKKLKELFFYRDYLTLNFELNNKLRYNEILNDFLERRLNELNIHSLLKEKIDNKFWEKMVRRRKNSFSFFLNHKNQDRISLDLLETYTKAYENDEILKIWYYISNKNQHIEIPKYFKYKNGSLKKGKIIRAISENLKGDIKKIFDTSYPRELRNRIDHNDVYIDNIHLGISCISDDHLILSKQDFMSTLFAIQTLQNLTISNMNITLAKEDDILNKGILGSCEMGFKEDESLEIGLIQLAPFFDFDAKHNLLIERVKVSIEGKKMKFLITDNNYIYSNISDNLKKWYKLKNPKINIIKTTPNTKEEKFDFGTLIFEDKYEVSIEKIKSEK